MSVKDYNRVFNIKNMTTGEIFETIDDEKDFPCAYENYVEDISCKLKIGDIKLLNAIHECLQENHGCLISIGYKAE